MALRNLRRARTLNQADLARLVGISQQSLSKIEKGILIPSVDAQARIAAILGVSRTELFPKTKRPRATVATEERVSS